MKYKIIRGMVIGVGADIVVSFMVGTLDITTMALSAVMGAIIGAVMP